MLVLSCGPRGLGSLWGAPAWGERKWRRLLLRSRLTGLYMVELGKRRKLLVQPGQHLPPPSWAGCECQKGCWTLCPCLGGCTESPGLTPAVPQVAFLRPLLAPPPRPHPGCCPHRMPESDGEGVAWPVAPGRAQNPLLPLARVPVPGPLTPCPSWSPGPSLPGPWCSGGECGCPG